MCRSRIGVRDKRAGVVAVADVYEDSIPMLDRTSTVQAHTVWVEE